MKTTFTTSDFNYDLPSELIAKRPLPVRTESRLLVVDRAAQQIHHCKFTDLVQYLSPNDLVVFNNTKVIPSRLYGAKETGGKIECVVDRIVSSDIVLALVRASKSPKPDSFLVFEGGVKAKVLGREGELFKLQFIDVDSVLTLLDKLGELSIPPYMERSADQSDTDRYQTVFAEKAGAVAAPTASLHFDQVMLNAFADKGIDTAKLTLHVGAGTFIPVRTEDLTAHVMHKEYVDVSSSVCEKIARARSRGGRVIAIGTTVVRSLESAAQGGEVTQFQGDTNLFITPGYTFRAIDVLFTNFHLPKSTLLMLVSAFGGYELIQKAYQQAIERQYRFFSYGDAMLIL